MRTLPCLRLAAAVALAVGASVAVGLEPSSADTQDDFEITGEVDGLYPGIDATLDARVTNPQPFTIRVMSVVTTVADANPDCPGSVLQFSGPVGPVDIASGKTGTVPLPLRMDLNAPTACEGAVWQLTFIATAVGDTGAGAPAAGTSAPGPTLPGGLAFTGANVVRLLAIAAVLVAAGLVALRMARGRES